MRTVSWSPCCRFHPAGAQSRLSQPTRLDTTFIFSVADSVSGALYFRGHFCVRLRYGPVTRRHSAMTLSMGFRSLVSLLPAIQATGPLAFTLAGLSPAEHIGLSWTHNGSYSFPVSRFP